MDGECCSQKTYIHEVHGYSWRSKPNRTRYKVAYYFFRHFVVFSVLLFAVPQFSPICYLLFRNFLHVQFSPFDCQLFNFSPFSLSIFGYSPFSYSMFGYSTFGYSTFSNTIACRHRSRPKQNSSRERFQLKAKDQISIQA